MLLEVYGLDSMHVLLEQISDVSALAEHAWIMITMSIGTTREDCRRTTDGLRESGLKPGILLAQEEQ